MTKPRFPEVDEDEFVRIMDCSTSDNTKKVINMDVKVLDGHYLAINITTECIELLLFFR